MRALGGAGVLGLLVAGSPSPTAALAGLASGPPVVAPLRAVLPRRLPPSAAFDRACLGSGTAAACNAAALGAIDAAWRAEGRHGRPTAVHDPIA